MPLSPDMFPMEHRQIWVDLFIRYNAPVPSSAAVERLFSMGSDVMRPKRSSLTAKNFEKLVFLKGNMNLLKGRWELEDSDEDYSQFKNLRAKLSSPEEEHMCRCAERDEDNVMECPVCLTAYDDKVQRPCTLPCGHTYCMPCVNGLMKQGPVACPNCRVVHAVPEAGQFPISYTIENLLMRMRGASLASPPPSAEKDAAESAHSPGTGPGQEGQQGFSKCVRSLLEEQEAKILAAIHSCQNVKAQLKKYQTIMRDWGREQQDLEDRLQALIDQCKDARELAQQEESSASEKEQQINQGEQQLHTVLQAVRTAASAGEAYETIEDAYNVMEEETQREECLAKFPDVHTVTTIKKPTTRLLSILGLPTAHHTAAQHPRTRCKTHQEFSYEKPLLGPTKRPFYVEDSASHHAVTAQSRVPLPACCNSDHLDIQYFPKDRDQDNAYYNPPATAEYTLVRAK
ncbi:Tripartite motif-containing protein 65 [Chionoecetes opilio]|uniref:Tripartite motif-containing protein 65 n=1 Tax=Chionoecetes opilio TaxID=41210 RepID=A0A8J4YIR2_CHIOP|nr:Tripartite motif-containing protein 65 [Chionoecetes opilio]